MTTLTKLNTFTVLIPLGLALVGCGPRSVAESFWRATKEGDFEKARLLATNDSSEALDFIEENWDNSDSRDFSGGDATVDGDKAMCHTVTQADAELPACRFYGWLPGRRAVPFGAWTFRAPSCRWSGVTRRRAPHSRQRPSPTGVDVP